MGAIAGLLAAAVIVALAATHRNDPTSSPPPSATAPAAATTSPTTAPPAPTTVAAVATSPATAGPATAVAADDLAAFISTLRAGDDRSGHASKQLGDRLEQLAARAGELAGNSSGHDLDKWQRDADKLRDDLTKWSEKGQLDPAVAAQAQTRIDRLASSING